MTRRQKIGIGLILLGILILLAILLYPRPEPVAPVSVAPTPQVQETVDEPKDLPSQPTVPTPGVTEPEPAKPQEPADGRTSLSRLAASFAERYGSYSTHNDFENLTDLTVLMSDSLAARTEEYVRNQMTGGPLPGYSGVSTRALKSEIVAYNEGSGTAEVTVSTQRSYSDGRLMFQDLHLKFIKSGSKWLVSAVDWDENQVDAR